MVTFLNQAGIEFQTKFVGGNFFCYKQLLFFGVKNMQPQTIITDIGISLEYQY